MYQGGFKPTHLELAGEICGQSAHGCCEHPVQSSKEQNIAGPIKEVEAEPAKEKEASLVVRGKSEQYGIREATRGEC